MTHKTTITDNYILLTSDEEIKDVRPHIGKWHLEDELTLNQFPDYLTDLYVCKLVIAHLPLNNAPHLEGVPLLPPFSCCQEDGAEEYSKECNQLYKDWLVAGYKAGYNKVKEKYRFTEEDMVQCFAYGRTLEPFDSFEDFIQSLSQPKMPIGFKCEIEVECTGNNDNGCFMDSPAHNCGCVSRKIINGIMQGEWVF